LIYLDSCVVIYAVEDHPRWGERSKAAITRGPDTKSAVSPLVKLECLVVPLMLGDQALAERFRQAFNVFETLSIPEAVYLRGAEIRAQFGLKTPDALHLACAQHHGCEAVWTNDGRLNKASRGLARDIFA
jgi:predicted nucleic acid-binding protein